MMIRFFVFGSSLGACFEAENWWKIPKFGAFKLNMYDDDFHHLCKICFPAQFSRLMGCCAGRTFKSFSRTRQTRRDKKLYSNSISINSSFLARFPLQYQQRQFFNYNFIHLNFNFFLNALFSHCCRPSPFATSFLSRHYFLLLFINEKNSI